MTCIKCQQPGALLWRDGRARIYQCLGGHYWESVELVTGPVHGPVPFGQAPVAELAERPQ